MEEMIVHFVGDPMELFQGETMKAELLLGGYAIVTGEKEELDTLWEKFGILFVEPTEILECEQLSEGVGQQSQICIESDRLGKGSGVLMAYLDSGIDYRHPEFLTDAGKSRIDEIYDLSGEEPRVYDNAVIEEALGLPREEGDRLVRSRDVSGHGTHVAAIGSGRSGVAPESEILMVKIGTGRDDQSSTAVLMRGIDYCVRRALLRQIPMVINISYGNSYGAHNGSSMVEQYLNEMLNYARMTVVVGAGNEGAGNGHFRGFLESNQPIGAKLSVADVQPQFMFQFWKRFEDVMEVEVFSPEGKRALLSFLPGCRSYDLGRVTLRVTTAGPSPVQQDQVLLMELIPEGDFLTAGIWEIRVGRMENRRMQFDIWLPVKSRLAVLTGFLNPTPESTLTIPSTATRVITVGALDTRYGQVADFSGRGFSWLKPGEKPDLVAPGVGVLSAAVGGGYTAKTGTSMAAPFVAGAAALLMEWGIVKGNDRFLYADKVKAYLIRGASPVSGIGNYPDERAGWGSLCIKNSLFED